MMPSSPRSVNFQALFHASSVDLVIPESGSLTNESGWWDHTRDLPARHVAFLDEKLFYAVVLAVSVDAVGEDSDEPPSELLRYLSRLQLTMTASFVPPLAPRPLPTGTTPNPNLLPPKTPNIPNTPDFAKGLPPITPNPFPMMDESADERYANVDGVVVWEGNVEDQGDNEVSESYPTAREGRVISKRDGRWEVVWRGHVPIAYVRTNIQHPLLSLTASVTLRDAPQKRRAGNAETGSILSTSSTIQTNGADYSAEDTDDLAGMEEIDLLGGLAGDAMPTSRLAPSLREDLSLPPSSSSTRAPMTAITPTSLPETASSLSSLSTAGPSRERAHLPQTTPLESNTTLRKSYRRVLSLSSGLRVRMRTLFLPQLLPPRQEGQEEDHENDEEGGKRIILSVEVENPIETDDTHPFEVTSIKVDVGGKGGKATTELMCDPSPTPFPLSLQPVEQYNLLYVVRIASAAEDRDGQGIEEVLARSLGKGDEQRPVAITVIGRPYTANKGDARTYPTREFSSRWNCNLDLAAYYNSLSSSIPPLPAPNHRISKPLSANAITGDKRYSLASLISQPPGEQRPVSQRLVSGTTQRPIQLPSSVVNVNNSGNRGSVRQTQREGHGLLVSIKILPTDTKRIEVLEPFSLEVFVHNRTEETKRFRLSIPGREEWTGKIREVWQKRRPRRVDEPNWGVDDPILRQMLLSHLSSAPSLVPLEDDLRCGPLLPGASMAARLRFMALREGVHSLEKLRVTGANDEFDFVLGPVLDIVVGSGVDHQ